MWPIFLQTEENVFSFFPHLVPSFKNHLWFQPLLYCVPAHSSKKSLPSDSTNLSVETALLFKPWSWQGVFFLVKRDDKDKQICRHDNLSVFCSQHRVEVVSIIHNKGHTQTHSYRWVQLRIHWSGFTKMPLKHPHTITESRSGKLMSKKVTDARLLISCIQCFR